MALKISLNSGDFGTAGTWGSASNVPTIHASTNINWSTGSIYTATFTAPDTSSYCQGMIVFVSIQGSGTHTYTVTLQEGGVDTATSVEFNASDIPTTGNYLFIRFPTPYQYTTTSANQYRFRIIRTGTGAIANAQMSADASGTLTAFLAVDDRSGAPGVNDDAFVTGWADNVGMNTVTVTVEANKTFGSGTNANQTVSASLGSRSWGNALYLLKGGTLKYAESANIACTVKGNIITYGGGTFEMKPTSTTYTHRLIHDQNGQTMGNFGIGVWTGGKNDWQGSPKSSTSLWKTKYASGVGTAADPLILADPVDWEVGDEIMVCASSDNATNYQESENKFIITKNSATSYVISNTSGGAEAALTYTHNSNAHVLNLQRNVIVEPLVTTHPTYYVDFSIDGLSDIKWTRFQYIGGTTAGRLGVYVNQNGLATGACTFDYNVGYAALRNTFRFDGNKKVKTYTGLIACNSNSVTNGGQIIISSSRNNGIFNDFFSVKHNRIGIDLGGMVNNTLNRPVVVSCNLGNVANTTASGGIVLYSVINSTINDAEVSCCRRHGIMLNTSNPKVTFNNLQCGTKGINTGEGADITCFTDNYQRVIFNESNFGSAERITNYTNMLAGSIVSFHTNEQTDNNHIWYTPGGQGRSTGAGLSDTTVRTPGSLGVRLAPEEATSGMEWIFYIPAQANSVVSFRGYFQKNTAFSTDVVTVELWLPGSTVADATITLSNTYDAWQSVSLSADNTSPVDSLATIKVIAITATASAYVYIDDFYNAGDTLTNSDKVTGLDTWFEGLPIEIIAPQTVPVADIVAAVWDEPNSNHVTAGTTGANLGKALDKGTFIALS